MFEHLPGSEILIKGLAALEEGRRDEFSALLLVGAPRLRRLGLAIPERETGGDLPEHRLFDLLHAQSAKDAYRRYNSLIRQLVSLERAMVLEPPG